MQHALTDLTLYSNKFVRAWSGMSLAELHLLCLCTLSLRKFKTSVGILPFVLRNASTLTRFEILSCTDCISVSQPAPASTALTVDEESSSEPGGWHRIWDRFAANLTVLVTLRADGPEFLDDPTLPIEEIGTTGCATRLTLRRCDASVRLLLLDRQVS